MLVQKARDSTGGRHGSCSVKPAWERAATERTLCTEPTEYMETAPRDTTDTREVCEAARDGGRAMAGDCDICGRRPQLTVWAMIEGRNTIA